MNGLRRDAMPSHFNLKLIMLHFCFHSMSKQKLKQTYPLAT